MFRFQDSNGDAMDATSAVLHPLLQWALPASLGGVRRWALGGRAHTIGGQAYAPYGGVLAVSAPRLGALPSADETWEFVLADSDGAWATLLRTFAGGTRADLRVLLEAGGAVSANAMRAAVGWVRSVAPADAEDGRVVSVSLASEFGSERRDASLPMTWDAERAVSASSNSLEFAGRTTKIAWGGRQGTRRNG